MCRSSKAFDKLSLHIVKVDAEKIEIIETKNFKKIEVKQKNNYDDGLWYG